ncbi:hypothetical protein [uncultured Clostridium sp.]|jgi:hypothetical protein|uniref:hypothetical protein n=1 Tax=uncultured Clostridium sp. TaxID=59620 RepID=UPI0026051BB2|nr:hypothetical protein [uncultured Clostridium sp.]
MKKVAILIIIVVAVGVGVFSYNEVAKADSTNNTISTNNPTQSTNQNNNSNQENNSNNTNDINNNSATAPEKSEIHVKTATDAKIETTHTTNQPSSESNQNNNSSSNDLFAYNYGVNVFYNENIISDHKQYENALTQKFKTIYTDKKNVLVKVSSIYTTVHNGTIQAVALYIAQYQKNTQNGSVEYYTTPENILSVNVGFDSLKPNTALFSKQKSNTPEWDISPTDDFPYENAPTYLSNSALSYELYENPSSTSPIIGTVSSKDIVMLMSPYKDYSLIAANGSIAFIKTSALLEDAPTIPTVPKIVYPTSINKFLEPIGYSLTLKGASYEGANISLLKSAMNYQFNGTGYKVVATNLEGFEGMMHYGCQYNITYTSPDGHVTTLKNQRINGLTNSDNGAFAFWFGNTANRPFNY